MKWILAQDSSSTMQDISTPGMGRLITSFFLLMAALGVVVWLLKKLSRAKLGFFQQESNLKIIERKSISPKSTLFVVEYMGKKILIAESNMQIKISHDIAQLDQDSTK